MQWPESISIEIAIDLSLRKILPVVNHHSGSIALQASIIEKLGCVSSEAFLPLLDLFFPLFAAVHFDIDSYIFTCATLNLLDIIPYKLC